MIGEGGMGTVLAAHHDLLDLPVAVKLLSPRVARNGPMVDRFLREVRAAAGLKSQHLARVTDVGTLESGQPYIVMELLQGEDLEERRQRLGKLPIDEAVDFLLQALEALAHAHAAGIVHRDLKPANLFLALLPDGREVVKVLDFGMARLIDACGGDREAGSPPGEHALGSPSYVAPEQIRNASPTDRRVDIWAIGAILYDLLTGQLPFPGDAVGEIFGNILVGTAPALRTLRPDAPAELEAAVERCLRREPGERFANVHELASAIAPHGSGAWSGHVERMAQTLARGGAPLLLEDTAVRRSPYLHPEGGKPLATSAIESVRVPPPSRKRTILVVSAGVLIAAFAALAVFRPRASTHGSATSVVADETKATHSSAETSSMASPPASAPAVALPGPPAPAGAEKAPVHSAAPVGSKAGTGRPAKRPAPLGAPD
jgi:serine/threonine protein kinase